MSQAFFYTILPWNFITKFHEGVVVQKDGLLQRTFAYRAPDTDSSSGYEIEDVSIRVNDFTKRLGAGWAFFIEAQRFRTWEYPSVARGRASGFDALAPYLIDKEREEAFTTSGKHYESSYFITFTWKPPTENVKKLTSMFIQSGSEGEGTGTKTIEENVEYFVHETDAVVGLLSQSIIIVPLNNDATVSYLHSTISFKRHYIHFPHTQIMLDRILPDSELVNSLTMKLGDYYIPIIGINDFPDETYPAMFEALNRARMEYRWVTRFICLDKEEAKKETAKKEKAHRGSRTNFWQTLAAATSGPGGGGEVKVTNHGASIKEADSIAAGVEIENDKASLGYYTSNIMVWDKDYEAAIKKAEHIIRIINSAGFTCKEEKYNAFESWKSMMPGQVYANYRVLPVMSYNLSHVIPLSSVWAGMRINEHAGHISGVSLPHLTCGTQEGTPFFMNLNPNDVGHTAVWGPTGSGKSTILNLLEAQFYKYPESLVIVFDKGKSCRGICLASGGLFYEPAAESAAGVAFQPLHDLESDRDLIDAMDFIESLCTVNGYTVIPPMRSAIKEAIELLRDKPPEQRTLTSFVQYCQYMDSETKKPIFKEWLSDYLWDGGKYGKIFDSSVSGLSLDTRFLAIEMEDLMNRGEGCIVPALIYLFNLVEKKFSGRLTLLVLDEAWLFLKNPVFAEKIAEWLKVLRKKNVFVVFATQDVADVEKSPLKTTIIQQCLTKIYLADPAAMTAGMFTVYRAFGLTDTEIDLIASATMKRDYFYTSPFGRRMFQLDLGPLTLALLGSPNHELLDRLIAEKGPGFPLCADILDNYNIRYEKYLGNDAPEEKRIEKPQFEAAPLPRGTVALPPVPAAFEVEQEPAAKIDAAGILDAVATIQNRNEKGKGRAAERLSTQLGVSAATIYQAKNILRYGDPELITRVRNGEIGIKKASQGLKAKETGFT